VRGYDCSISREIEGERDSEGGRRERGGDRRGKEREVEKE
jgi:hypothetical protein